MILESPVVYCGPFVLSSPLGKGPVELIHHGVHKSIPAGRVLRLKTLEPSDIPRYSPSVRKKLCY